MDKQALLDRVSSDREERLTLARVLDKWELAERRSVPSATEFLSPRERQLAESLLRQAGAAEDRRLSGGGYDGAERQMLLFLPDWMDAGDAEDALPLRCLRASYRSEYQLTHRDILGSLMGLGIVREKLGDLLVGEESCDLIVADSVADFLLQSWESAGRAKLSLREVDRHDLHIPQAQCQEIRDTVAALRLDAVASSALRMARGKAAALIESGRVQVNWRECTKPDKLLAAGDTVSVRGFGKFELAEVGGTTKKGRVAILIRRYV